MPRVPRADQNPTGIAPLPGVRVSTGAPASAFGGQPQSLDLSGVSRQAADLFEREQQKADQVALVDADNQLGALQTSLLYDRQTGILNKKGKDALGAPEHVSEGWQKGVGEIEKSLSTDRQRMAFQGRVAGRWDSVNQTVQRHVADQSLAYDNETANAALSLRMDDAVRSAGDDKAVGRAVAETQAILGDYGRRNGWGAEIIAQKKAEATSRMHAAVIDQLLAGDQDLAAQKYFDANKDGIAGQDSIRVTKMLEDGSVRGESQRQADAIVAKANGMPAALELVRKITDPKIRDATDQRVKQYFTEQKVASEERRQANYQTATNIVEQFRTVDRVPPSVWSSFTVGERGELRNYAEKLVKGEPIQTNWTRFYDLMSLASSDVTKQQFLKVNLLADRANLGDAEFKQLTEIQTSLRKDDGKAAQQLGGYQTINEVVERSLREAGKDVAKAKPGSDEARDIALFRRSVDVQVQALEQQTGKKATDADAQRIVDNLLVKGTVLGSGGMFSSGQQKAVYQRSPGDRLVLSAKDIPVLERQRIETALRANRLPVSDAAILKLYLKRIGQIPTLAPPNE